MHALSFRAPSARRGFTLVEVLVATVLVLIMLATVVSVFASMSDSMKDSRAMIEVNDRVRYTKDRLQLDLAGVTVPMLPPRRPESGEGYFEYIEGPVGPILPPQTGTFYDIDGDGNTDPDSTVGDNDDILMFTTRSAGEPFVGKAETANGTAQSQVAEVCWFLRGTTLYRRQLLVAPGLETTLTAGWAIRPGFYANNDISVRQEGGTHDWRRGGTAGLRLNTLGDLTKRENRYGHQPWAYPHDARFWGLLGLPTLRECASVDGAAFIWPFPLTANLVNGANVQNSPYFASNPQVIVPAPGTMAAIETMNDFSNAMNPWRFLLNGGTFDAWDTPNPWSQTNPVTGNLAAYSDSTRIADDVILTNVLSFDVKAWDPGAPVFQNASATATIEPTGEYPEQHWYKYNRATPFDPPRRFFETGVDFSALTPAERPIGFGAYVDLNYLGGMDVNIGYPQSDLVSSGMPQSDFFGPGENVFLVGQDSTAPPLLPNAAPAVYDTWSTHYEHDGFDQDDGGTGAVDEGSNGFDDNNQGGVDDVTEKEAPPPYPVPLRGIQVKIRVFDPGTRQIREVTVVQDFVAQ